MKASTPSSIISTRGTPKQVATTIGQEARVVQGERRSPPHSRDTRRDRQPTRPSVASSSSAVVRVLRSLSNSASSSAFTTAPPRPTADAPPGVGLLDEPEEGLLEVRGPLQAVQHDPVQGRELPDLLGCRVHGEPLVRTAVREVRGVEGGAEPVRVRGPHHRADTRLSAQGGKGRGPEQPPMSQDEHVVGDQLDLAQRMAGQQHRATFVREPT